jgi:hypothetical protein
MHFFSDRAGHRWQIVIGRESWGSYLAFLVPVDRSEPVRWAPLRAVSQDAAQDEIDALGEPGLQKLLDDSRVREG